MTNIEMLKEAYDNYSKTQFPSSEESELLDTIIEDNLLEFDGYFAGHVDNFITNKMITVNIDSMKKDVSSVISLLKKNRKEIGNTQEYENTLLYLEKINLIIGIVKNIIESGELNIQK